MSLPVHASSPPPGGESDPEKILPESSEAGREGWVNPSISDFEMLKRIGRGSYGQVWLARSATGSYRAIKVVHREAFDGDRPYEREFEGIRQFEPLSRAHPGQLDILHVGREDADGYFYYVMELADDASQVPGEDSTESRHAESSSLLSSPPTEGATGTHSGSGSKGSKRARRPVDPESYLPLTLHERIKLKGRLRFPNCLDVAIALAEALDYLHANGLVHRDIKPANVVFVRGRPKLADIGLVAQADARVSIVGTEGFLPPEGPGKTQADLYSLGKVFYEMATGKDRRKYPEPPDDLEDPKEKKVFLEFNEILLHCCEANAANRYQSAADLLTDLHLVRQGRSVRRLRMVERKLAAIRKVAVVTSVAAVVLAVALWQIVASNQRERDLNLRLEEQTGELQKANVDLENANAELGDTNTALDRSNAELRDSKLRLQEDSAIRAMESGRLADAALLSAVALSGAEDRPEFAARQRYRIGVLLQYIPLNAGTVPLPGQDSRPHWFELSQDGTFLLVTSSRQTTEIWDLDPIRKRTDFYHPKEDVVELSPDSRYCVTHGRRSWFRPKVWDLAQTPPSRRTLTNKLNNVAAPLACFIAGGQYLVTGRNMGTKTNYTIWNPATGEELAAETRYRHAKYLVPHPTKPWFLHQFGNTNGSGMSWMTAFDPDQGISLSEDYQGHQIQEGGWHPFSPDRDLFLARDSWPRFGVQKVTVHALTENGEPIHARMTEFDVDPDIAMQGGGFLAGGNRFWVDFTKGVAVCEVDSGNMRWFDDPPNSGAGRPHATPDGSLVALVGDTETAFLDGRSGKLLPASIPFGVRSPATAHPYHGLDPARTRISLGPERPEGRLAAFSSPHGGAIQLINLKGLIPRPIASFNHAGEVQSVAFNKEGTLLPTGSTDQSARVWDVARAEPASPPMDLSESGAENKRERAGPRVLNEDWHVPFVEAHWSPNEDAILAVGGGSQSWLRSPEGKKLAEPFEHSGGIHQVAFRSNGTHYLTTGKDNAVRIYPTGDPKDPGIHLDKVPWSGNQGAFATFHPTRTEVVAGGGTDRVAVWDWNQPEKPKFEIVAPNGSGFRRAEYTSDGSRIVTQASPPGAFHFQVWDAQTGQQISAPFGLDGFPLSDFELSPDGAYLYAFQDFRGRHAGVSTVACWELGPAPQLRPGWPLWFSSGVTATLGPDGSLLVAATRDDFRILDAATGKALTPAIEVEGTIVDIDLAPDNHHVAVGCADGMATVWRVASTDRSAEELVDLTQYHSWKKVINGVEIGELSIEELDALQELVQLSSSESPDAVKKLRATARLRAARNDIDGALAIVQEALDTNPNDPLSWKLKTELLKRLGRLDDLIEANRELIRFATASGNRELADTGFRQLLDALENKGEAVNPDDPERASTLRRMAGLGHILRAAHDTIEIKPGDDKFPELEAPSSFTLINRGTSWRYFDRGAPSPNWREADFDDTSWSSGNAPLGFGDDQLTKLAKNDPEGNPLLSACFRHRFQLSSPDHESIGRLIFSIRRDDGAVVYLNGKELVRTNLPDGPLTLTATATNTVAPEHEATYHRFEVSPELLRPGENVLAVAVHQRSAGSTDLTFDLGLEATSSHRAALGGNAASLVAAAAELQERLPTSFGAPWRDYWIHAVDEPAGAVVGGSPQAALFREHVQALLDGQDPAVLALEAAIEARSSSFAPETIRERKNLLRLLEEHFTKQDGTDEDARVRERIFAPPPRDPAHPVKLVDLSDHYNSSLYDGRAWLGSEHSLRMLPETFDQQSQGLFDLRGIVQLNSGIFKNAYKEIVGKDVATHLNRPFPAEVTGIRVDQRARKLHFLHGECYSFIGASETEVARYVVHYADGGGPHVISVRHGRDVVDWWHPDKIQDERVLAWTGALPDGPASGRIGLTKMTWENPNPDRVISHLDFVSAKAQSAPFLLAVTVE